MKPTGKTNIEFKIWDDLPGIKVGREFPKRFQVYGWDAEVIGNEDGDAHRIMRIRFFKEGYQPMDMAVTHQLLADASPGQLRDMFSEKVMAHQRAQELLGRRVATSDASTVAKPFKVKKEGPPPNAPSGAVYKDDYPNPLQYDRNTGFFNKMTMTINEVGVKATISEVLQATESAQLKSMAMMSTRQMREYMPMLEKPKKGQIVDLGYAAMLAPMVKQDLYSAMYPSAYAKKTDVPKGPEAKDEGDWA